MKHILIFYIFTLACMPLSAMEKMVPKTTFKHVFNQSKNQHALFAYRNDQFAGNLFYQQSNSDKSTWKIVRLTTEQNFKRQYVATSLFSNLIEQLQHKKAKLLKWKAEPLNENIDPETLGQVYTKIVTHLNLFDYFESQKIQGRNGNNFYKMRLEIPSTKDNTKISLIRNQGNSYDNA